jgi:hypothetical protein
MRFSKISFDGSLIEAPATRHRLAGTGQVAASVARVARCLLCLGLLHLSNAHGQETQRQEFQPPERSEANVCPDPPPQTSGSHGFRWVGETIDIPVNFADCQPVAFVMRWSNGGNHGSSLSVTFLDSMNQPIYTQALSGFLSGTFELPFASLDRQPWFARGSVVAVPTTIVIQALPPFAPPANISYMVTRKAARVRTRSPENVQPVALSKSQPVSGRGRVLDEQVAMKLRTAEGRLLSEGHGSFASGSKELIRYKVTELVLPEPREIEIHGRRETVEFAYRLTLAKVELGSSQKGGTSQSPALSKFGLLWLDDAALPVFSLDPREISTLIYDRSVLRDGAKIAVSSADGSDMYSLAEGLKYQFKVQVLSSSAKVGYESSPQSATFDFQSGKNREEGNQVVAIRNAVRVIGATRMPLVQIELRTSRPFPPRDSALQLQIGKRFFLNELTGDHTGRTLMLTLAQETFAELNQGAEIVAFFDKPDSSGFSRDVWHFGRLDKTRMQ